MRRLQALFLWVLMARPAFAQTAQGPTADTAARYQAVDVATLSGSGERLTVQQVTSAKKIVVFESATVYCSVACVATIYQNGTAATTTALTPNALNGAAASSIAAFSASNAGNGGWAHPTQYNVAAGQILLLDLSKFYMDASSTQNLSIAVSSITGNATIIMQWVEK